MGTTKRVKLTKIVRDPSLQARKRLDHAAIKRYVYAYRSGRKLPPVEIASVKGALLLVDGWHRVEALERLGQSTVEAEVTEGTRKDAAGRAARANLNHGLPLRASEHRRVFALYVEAGHHRNGRRVKSYREMAADLGGFRPHTTIRNWMKQDFPAIAAARDAEDNGADKGGLRTPSDENREQWALSDARDSVDRAVTTARLIKSAPLLADLIRHAADRLYALKRLAAERGVDEDPENPFGPWPPPTVG